MMPIAEQWILIKTKNVVSRAHTMRSHWLHLTRQTTSHFEVVLSMVSESCFHMSKLPQQRDNLILPDLEHKMRLKVVLEQHSCQVKMQHSLEKGNSVQSESCPTLGKECREGAKKAPRAHPRVRMISVSTIVKSPSPLLLPSYSSLLAPIPSLSLFFPLFSLSSPRDPTQGLPHAGKVPYH